MPKYSGFDPIESHNVVKSSTTTSGVNYGSDPVSLYLPFDSDIQDASANNHTVTAYGDAAISSTQAKFGGNSLSLDGTDDYLQIADNAAFEFGSGDWTLETWFYQNDNTGHIIAQKRNTNGTWGTGAWTLGVNTNYGVGNEIIGRIEFFSNEFNTGSPLLAYEKGSAFSSGWHHLALTRAGGDWKLFLDGSVVASATWTGTMSDASFPLTIGRDTYAGAGQRGYMNGYLDDFRIIKGVARYTKSFIPPSQAVGATLNGTNETNTTTGFTSLYLPFDSDVNDDSSHGHSVTASGDAAISSSYSKFGGNSLAVDGNGDFLSIPDSDTFNFEDGDFTVECFIRADSINTSGMTSSVATFVDHDSNAGTTGAWFSFSQQNATLLWSVNNATLITTSSCLSATTWHHVAAVRTSGTTTIYCDGVNVGSASDTQDYDDSTSRVLYIGKQNSNTRLFTGYIDDLRILKGYAKYTADFVSPTSAVGTSVSETVNDLTTLYLPFDDSSFEDQARNHGVNTTGGSPEISTSVKKFGTSSLDLTGGSDYVWYNHDESLNFGTGDFTVEAWFYVTNSSSVGRWLGKSNLSPYYGWFIVSNTNGTWGFNAGSGTSSQSWDIANNASLGTLTGNVWTHLAITREGNTFRLFNNGSLITTITSSLTMTISDAPFGIGRQGGNASNGVGYIDDIRIIKGKAVYTEAFTAPSSAHGTELSESSTSQSTDTKSLSSTWTMTNDGSSPRTFIDMRLDNTWANNEHLQSQPGHRWYDDAGGGGSNTPVTMKVWGAGGGGAYWNGGSAGHGGAGGFTSGTMNITPGTTLNVVVGTKGLTAGPGRSTPTYPTYPTGPARPLSEGGGGTEVNGTVNHLGASGGGFSAVFDGPVSKPNAIIVAGGGGGGTAYDRSGDDESGGGGSGTPYGNPSVNPPVAAGGGYSGSPTDMQGGVGTQAIGPRAAGGGGGGYRGGQGGFMSGSDGNEHGTGGGGGSGYVAPAMSSTTTVTGSNGTAGSSSGLQTNIHPTASSDPNYTSTYGKGGGYNSDGAGGYVVITSPSGTTTFTAPGTYTVP